MVLSVSDLAALLGAAARIARQPATTPDEQAHRRYLARLVGAALTADAYTHHQAPAVAAICCDALASLLETEARAVRRPAYLRAA